MTYEESTSSKLLEPEKDDNDQVFNPAELFKKVQRSDDGYEPGAIRKVTLENFVTYKHAVFSIGPSLNMIIGPNGSGKSTIVCAICLALGGKPEILGRAKTPADFIRYGETSAKIVIELQNHIDESVRKNVTITRTIFKESSSWRIGRKSCTAKEVSKKVAEFNIQIDNLCQFLPQDKVASFAGLPSTELLLETERAVGSERMVDYHKSLIVLDRENNTLEKERSYKQEKLEEAQSLQAADQEIIERIKEYEETVTELEAVKVAIDALRYRDVNKQKNLAEQERTAAENRFDEMKESTQHFKEKVHYFSSKSHEIQVKIDETQADRQEVQQRYHEKNNYLKILHGELEGLKPRYQKVKTMAADRANKIKMIESEILNTKSSIESNPSPDKTEMAKIEEKLLQLRHELSESKNEYADIQEQKRPVMRKLNNCYSILTTSKNQLANMQSVQTIRVNAMKRSKNKQVNDTLKAVIWLSKKENQKMFSERIFEPPMLTLYYKDNKLLDIASAAIDGNTMLTFTAQNRSDYELFSREIIDKLRLGVSIREYSKTNSPKLSDQIRPFNTEELNSYGLTGVVLDFLEGPAPVLNMLCHSCRVNAIPYCADVLRPDQIEKINTLTRKNGDPLFTKYFDRNYYVNLSRSRHGQKLMTSATSKLHKHSDRFVVEGSNNSEIKEINNRIKTTEESVTELKEELEKFDEKLLDIQKQNDPILEDISQVEVSKQEFKEKAMLHNKLIARLESSEARLQELRDMPDNTHEKYVEVDAAMEAVCKKVVSTSRNLQKILKLHIDLEAQYSSLIIERDIADHASKYYHEFATSGLAEVEQALEAAVAKHEDILLEFRKIKRQVKEAIASLPEKGQAFVKSAHENEDLTIDDLLSQKSRLEFQISSTEDENFEAALRRYEERTKLIGEYSEHIQTISARVEKIGAEITNIRRKWEPELHLIVETISREFSKAFENINCRGKVVLGNTDKSFKDWSMDVMVSFRHDTELQVLTHQRQSGGERAVSTIFYLISLQRLTKSPFRVVDEINQGMDPRNERIVHSHMVSVACAHDSSQYFLITPKLLQDLTYDRKMKVHIIFSGPHVSDVSGFDVPLASSERIVKSLRDAEAAGYF